MPTHRNCEPLLPDVQPHNLHQIAVREKDKGDMGESKGSLCRDKTKRRKKRLEENTNNPYIHMVSEI